MAVRTTGGKLLQGAGLLVALGAVLFAVALASARACDSAAFNLCTLPTESDDCAAVREFVDCARAAGCENASTVQAIEAANHACLTIPDPELYTTDGVIVMKGEDIRFETGDGGKLLSAILQDIQDTEDSLTSTQTRVSGISEDAASLAQTLGDALASLESPLSGVSSTQVEVSGAVASTQSALSSAIATASQSVESELSAAISGVTEALALQYNQTREVVREEIQDVQIAVSREHAAAAACRSMGLFYNHAEEVCEAVAPRLSSDAFTCNADSRGRIRFDDVLGTVLMCDGSEFVTIDTRSCDSDQRGRTQDCPADSCAAIKAASSTAASGMYYVGTVQPVPLLYCDMQHGISRGGNGTRGNPGADCLTLKTVFSMPTGTYWLATPTGLAEAFCEMELGGGGWQLVWLHEYYHVSTPEGDMRFYSQSSKPCTALDLHWCNTPAKTQQRATEQMTAAYRDGVVQYAWKAHINHLLDTDYRGGILREPNTKLVDRCTQNQNIPPEPVSEEQTNGAFGGVTFDKANSKKYSGNCDTDRYGDNGNDCRWENCRPGGTVHNQMSMTIFIRTSEEEAIRRAREDQLQPLSSCTDVLTMDTPRSGIYNVAVGEAAAHLWCEVSDDGKSVVSLGGNGLTEGAASVHCSILKDKFRQHTGSYWLSTEKGIRRGYCDMDLDGGGWMLVWKHSYYQVGTVTDAMRFYSSVDTPCRDLDHGWCNEAHKADLFATEQMTAAFHFEQVVYAYKGAKHPHHDQDWSAAILSSPARVVDHCRSNEGVPPEPVHGAAGQSFSGVTFDKANARQYTGNCDTDRYGENGNDCRWENCNPTFGNHKQMTVALYLRASVSEVIAHLFAGQRDHSTCKAIKAATGTTVSGTYEVTRGSSTREVYCEMTLDGGGWEMVWKHSYLQVGTPHSAMAFFSQFDRPCTDLSDGWCNEPDKTQRGAAEQMTAAYHHGILTYAYKGALNSHLDTDWTGAELSSASALYDRCNAGNGVRPEPVHPDQDYSIPGITFDKTNPGNPRGNCDTDRYARSSQQDCRWENCAPPTGNHNQMTMAIFIR